MRPTPSSVERKLCLIAIGGFCPSLVSGQLKFIEKIIFRIIIQLPKLVQ